MTLHDYPMAGPADMTLAAFTKVLADANSPARFEASGMYSRLVNNGVSPAVFLGFFQVESRFGTVGVVVTHDTKNPGNVRTPEEPATAIEIVQTPRGPFARYATWTLGTYDWCKRILGPKYAGSGLRTVRQVLPKYAPEDDDNVPEAYIASVLRFVEAHARPQEEIPVGNPRAKLTDFQEFLDADAPNNPGRVMFGGSPNFITIHETGNLKAGADARMHKDFVLNGGGEFEVSFHATIDERSSYQMLPWNAVAWHAGDGTRGVGNNDSIAIETVQVGNFRATVANLARLTARLMKEWDLPLDRVVQHNHWSGKDCPQYLRAGRLPISNAPGITWHQFLNMVKAERANLDDAVRRGNEIIPFIHPDGRPGVTVLFEGQAKHILGVDVADVGISVLGLNDKVHDQSVQRNAFNGWRVRE